MNSMAAHTIQTDLDFYILYMYLLSIHVFFWNQEVLINHVYMQQHCLRSDRLSVLQFQVFCVSQKGEDTLIVVTNHYWLQWQIICARCNIYDSVDRITKWNGASIISPSVFYLFCIHEHQLSKSSDAIYTLINSSVVYADSFHCCLKLTHSRLDWQWA